MMSFLCNKKALFIFTGIFFIVSVSIYAFYLLSDEYLNGNFRTMQDKIDASEEVNLAGLNKLYASGSPITDFSTLKKKLDAIRKPVIIVDVTRGSHGYINGTSTTYFAYNSRRKPELRYLVRRLLFTGTMQQLAEDVVHEREVAQQYGFGYARLQVESKRVTTDKAVDEFVTYFDKAPEEAWFHFHCRHGKGRTTLALVMFDIIRNAPEVSLKDIVKRQFLLRSVDLYDTTVWNNNNTYTAKELEDRKKFIENFYDFIVQRKAGGLQQWSEWYRRERKA